MPYKAHIRKNSTGEIRVYSHAGQWDEISERLWSSDGNWGCDCNLADFFDSAGTDDDPEEVDCPCGETAFSLMLIELDDGRRLVLDEHREFFIPASKGSPL